MKKIQEGDCLQKIKKVSGIRSKPQVTEGLKNIISNELASSVNEKQDACNSANTSRASHRSGGRESEFLLAPTCH
jgi:hypothetical protein